MQIYNSILKPLRSNFLYNRTLLVNFFRSENLDFGPVIKWYGRSWTTIYNMFFNCHSFLVKIYWIFIRFDIKMKYMYTLILNLIPSKSLIGLQIRQNACCLWIILISVKCSFEIELINLKGFYWIQILMS